MIPRFRSRPNGRALLAPVLAALLLASVACREKTAPQTPTRLEAASPLTQSVVVGSALPQPFAVRALDQSGRGVAGVKVSFAVTQGEATLSPTAAETDGSGRAQTAVTVGTLATETVITASSVGLPSVDLVVTVQPAPLDHITVVPRNRRLVAIGDTARFRLSAEDAHRNQVAVSGATWTSLDPALFTVTAEGVVTAMEAGRTGRLVATVGARSDTAWVSVADPAASACLGYGAAQAMAPGQVIAADARTLGACVQGAGLTAEYVAIPVHMSGTPSSTVGLEVYGDGTGSGVVAREVHGAAIAGADADAAQALQRDHRFDMTLRRAGREVFARRWADARAARAARALDEIGAEEGTAMLVPTGAVGSVVQVNGSVGTSCTVKEMRSARVMAVSRTAVVLADTENPAGGFEQADYEHYANTFDTLVTPVDTLAFGAATDVDRNGRVVLFFSRVVNQLSSAASRSYVAGFFHPRDVIPAAQCPASNDGEMMYLVVPDPQGAVRTLDGGQARPMSRAFVDSITVATLAHEYQHLINSFRRAYVIDAPEDEVDWLNEGLSHIAEELVFFRATGSGPGQNIGAEFISTAERRTAFYFYMKQNLDRLSIFLSQPESNAPWSGTEVAPRGAVWSFLRYAADQRVQDQSQLWRRLVDSRTSGIPNLQAAFGVDVLGLERDWLVSLVADDYAAGVDPRYTQPSWNARSLYASYPLRVRTLANRTTHALAVRGGGAAYFRYGVAAGADGMVRLTSGGILPRGNVQFLVIRTK